MPYEPHQQTRDAALAYFNQRSEQFPHVANAITDFLANPRLSTAREVMRLYFLNHTQGDTESLQMATSVFASKRLVRSIVESILKDESELQAIAARSYPHPIGFDKLVLYHDKETNFKFRLHIYWRGNQRAVMERLHLHRFEMASAIISGEMTNHIWSVTDFTSASPILPSMQITSQEERASITPKTMYAYSGYFRDKEGVLHKAYLGDAQLVRGTSKTMVSGQSYAQVVEDGHYVETNAETGTSNGDICATIYVHGPGLRDDAGRGIPILFEDERLPNDDTIIDTIDALTSDQLRHSLVRFRNLLNNSIQFYDWLYDEKHGRNLSAGMIAGYLLSERHNNPHTISLWLENEAECRAELQAHEKTLARLVRGDMSINDFSDDDRTKRYFAMLLEKAQSHPRGKEYWLSNYGNLVKEMWRYCGALRGEQPDLQELKPIWTDIVGRDLPGGAHYGHIAAMLEAGFQAKKLILSYFRADNPARGDEWKEDAIPFSKADTESENTIRAILQDHFPSYWFKGEESGESTDISPTEGQRRWLVDALDGSRNFIAGRNVFCSMIACQKFVNGSWDTTDSVIVDPMNDRIWWAEKGRGAFCIEGNNREYKVRVPNKDMFNNMAMAHPFERRLVDISVKGLPRYSHLNLINALLDNSAVYRSIGSTGLMLISTADGQNDGAVVTANDYDIEPGKLIAREAGVHIREIFFKVGQELRSVTITAASQEIEDALAAAVMGIQYTPPQSAP